MYINIKRGITFIEVLVTISIILIISGIVFLNLSSFRNQQSLKNTAVDIVSILNEAKQNTLSSLNSTNYGVHFEQDSVTLFIGAVYSSDSVTNKTTIFDSSVLIPAQGGINVGGGDDVVFERLTGETIGGTITLQSSADASKQKIINISKTGLVNIN